MCALTATMIQLHRVKFLVNFNSSVTSEIARLACVGIQQVSLTAFARRRRCYALCCFAIFSLGGDTALSSGLHAIGSTTHFLVYLFFDGPLGIHYVRMYWTDVIKCSGLVELWVKMIDLTLAYHRSRDVAMETNQRNWPTPSFIAPVFQNG